MAHLGGGLGHAPAQPEHDRDPDAPGLRSAPPRGLVWAQRQVGAWAGANGFDRLPDFPSNNTRARAKREGFSRMGAAYLTDFKTYSTNLFTRRVEWTAGTRRPWPTLEC